LSWFHLKRAAQILRTGGIVAHATEGVWGLACDAQDGSAVARLLRLKGRSPARGLIVIGAQADWFAAELAGISTRARARVCATWPGPHTYLLPNVNFAPWITGASQQVAVRVPGHLQARALLAEFGQTLVSTSANPSGRPAAVEKLKVSAYFGSKVDYLLPGRVDTPGLVSSLEDAVNGVVLRSSSTS
jgi:L-threonylcarbamoyladenylate synthase